MNNLPYDRHYEGVPPNGGEEDRIPADDLMRAMHSNMAESSFSLSDSPYLYGTVDPNSSRASLIPNADNSPVSPARKHDISHDASSPMLDYHHVNLDGASVTRHGHPLYTSPASPLGYTDSVDHSESSSIMMQPPHRVLVDDDASKDSGDEVPIATLVDSYMNKSSSGFREGDTFVTNNLHGRTGYRDEDSEISDSDSELDPFPWMTMADVKESDDVIHNPDVASPKSRFEPWRAVFNLGTIFILVFAILMLFAGYPILHNYTERQNNDQLSQTMGHLQYTNPQFPSGAPLRRINNSKVTEKLDSTSPMLIDPDTPDDAYEVTSHYTGDNKKRRLKLVFSDEFNTDGRSFYPGEDPFWEAADLHYWATSNYEWYDPASVTTKDGSLRINLDYHPEHNLYFRGGMLQSWNKFCFRNGLLTAKIQMPGFNNVSGLWPAFWMMGNLGRAGYGATLEGTWPYSYDVCDVGTVMNQTLYNDKHPNGYPPMAQELGGAAIFNMKHNSTSISFLPGQKLSRCTCPGEDHPGPFKDGEFAGRSAPEIDVFEGQVSGDDDFRYGQVSQSFQMAPFNWQYNITWQYGKKASYHFFDNKTGTLLNPYTGEYTQQAMSGAHMTNQGAYQYTANDTDTSKEGNFSEYALEYRGGPEGYVVWTCDGKPSWELFPKAIYPDPLAKVDHRQFSKEPMYIILNLGMSRAFGAVDWETIPKYFPHVMAVDWIRVYQDPDDPEADIGCDPDDMPTAAYINRHIEAYTNPNLTAWGGERKDGGYGAHWPRNRLYVDGCKAKPSTEPGETNPKYRKQYQTIPADDVTKKPGSEGKWMDVYDVKVAPDAAVKKW